MFHHSLIRSAIKKKNQQEKKLRMESCSATDLGSVILSFCVPPIHQSPVTRHIFDRRACKTVQCILKTLVDGAAKWNEMALCSTEIIQLEIVCWMWSMTTISVGSTHLCLLVAYNIKAIEIKCLTQSSVTHAKHMNTHKIHAHPTPHRNVIIFVQLFFFFHLWVRASLGSLRWAVEYSWWTVALGISSIALGRAECAWVAGGWSYTFVLRQSILDGMLGSPQMRERFCFSIKTCREERKEGA